MNHSRRPALLLSLPLLLGVPACVSSSSSQPATQDGGGSPSGSDGGGTGTGVDSSTDAPPTNAPPAAAQGIYVSNAGTNAITVFPLAASGNVAPTRVIAGSATGLSLPIGLAVDGQGNLFAANRTGTGVTVYPDTATGNVAPARTLTSSGMLSAQALALGAAGDLYVSTCPGCGQSGGGDVGVYHFPSGASATDRVIGGATNANTMLTDPGSLALDPSGYLYVGNSFGGVVAWFPTSASGDVAPAGEYAPGAGVNLQSIAQGAGTVFVSDPGSGIEEYGESGDGGLSGTIPSSALSLSYPAGMFVDTRGATPVLYVLDYSGDAIDIVETSGSAGGWVAGSVTTISGASTQIDQPVGITVVF